LLLLIEESRQIWAASRLLLLVVGRAEPPDPELARPSLLLLLVEQSYQVLQLVALRPAAVAGRELPLKPRGFAACPAVAAGQGLRARS
jgi:hypothetical protein